MRLHQQLIVGFSVLLILIGTLSVSAQYKLDKEVSSLYVEGTSTLHDWMATAEGMKGELKANVEDQHIVHIKSAHIVIPAKSIKSGKSKLDENMHNALKAEQYPNITFDLNNHTIYNGQITVKGDLTIAGTTKSIKANLSQEEVGKHIKVKGEVTLDMTEFNIKPPEFMFGSFSVGKNVTVTFYFMFCQTK